MIHWMHTWTKWEDVTLTWQSYSGFYCGEGDGQKRYCTVCGKKELRKV